MDNSIRNILKNAGKDPKEIKFQEELKQLEESAKSCSYVASVVVEALKNDFENDVNQTEKVYTAHLRISTTYPFKIEESEFDINELISAYNHSHADSIMVYNNYYVFNSTALIEYLKQYGIRTEVSLSSIYASIPAEKFRELVREASDDNYKRR